MALEIEPVSPATYLAVPFTFDISMAVRKGNDALKDELDRALDRHCAEVESILHRYGVPRVAKEGGKACGPSRPLPAL